MNKSYFQPGEEVTVEELEAIVAVEAGKGNERVGGAWKELREALYRRAGDSAQIADAETELHAFVEAGWTFERRSEAMTRALAQSPRLPATDRVARIYLQQAGRLLLETGQLSVRLDAALSEAECHKVFEGERLDIVRRLKFAPNLFEVRVGPGVDFLDLCLRLHDRGPFVYSEPQFIEYIGPRFEPTDPDSAEQWHFDNIRVKEAWKWTRGAGTRLAIIDNGMEIEHEDLRNAVEPSSGFFNASGAFVRRKDAPNDYPFHVHGTFCAGLAVARANNGKYGCGVACEARLVAVSCLPDHVGTQPTLARAVSYAADPTMEVADADPGDGADVISCSIGSRTSRWRKQWVLKDAIEFAVKKGRGGRGTPVFWAVTNGDHEIRFDQVCSDPNVIAVGRSTKDDFRGKGGFGPELAFLAPGVNVKSMQAGGGFGSQSGTSYATPIAAGIAALVLSRNNNLKWEEVSELMRDTCNQVGGVMYEPNGRNDWYGFGRVNAGEAVHKAGEVDELIASRSLDEDQTVTETS